MTLETLQVHEAYVLPYLQHDYRRKSLERLVQDYVTGKKILDIRCLTGQLAVDLILKGFSVTGLDAHPKGVELANRHARKHGINRDIARLWDLAHLLEAVGAERFDAVICLDVLNHVEDDAQAIRQVAQVLVDGGRVVIAAPAFPSLYGKRDRMLGHQRRYTQRGIRELLERHGLQIHYRRYWNLLGLLPYILVERILNTEIPERLRYGRHGSLPNRLLRWWYMTIENRVPFPIGLTHFVVAEKRAP